jgi:hypothetical protein
MCARGKKICFLKMFSLALPGEVSIIARVDSTPAADEVGGRNLKEP